MSGPSPYYRPAGMGYPSPPPRTHWLPVIIGGVLAAVAIVLLLILLYPTAFGLPAPSGSDRYAWGGGIFLAFFVVLILFFVVRVAFWSSRMSRYRNRYQGGPPGGYGANRPEMVARMRYARGEITREQYEQIMRDLGRPPGPA